MTAPGLFGFAGARGALLDIDGTLLDGDAAIPGAAELLRRLRALGVPFRLATNTTRRPRAAIAVVLHQAGLDVGAGEILVPARLARRRIVGSGRLRAGLLVPAACRVDFEGVVEDEAGPDWVVVGDLGHGFTFDRLNDAFRWLRAGAGLIALQKNRYWNAGAEGILLDAGAFVAALEYASGVTAEVVGKPAPAFFELALEDLGLPGSAVVCVGDSLENDCEGAARAGFRTVLLRPAGPAEPDARRPGARPDRVARTIADLLPDLPPG